MKILYLVIFLTLLFMCLQCNKATKDDYNIVCNKIQNMSERCEAQILEIFKRNPAVSQDSKISEFNYNLISSRIQKKIQERQAYKQCIRYSKSSYEEDIKRYKNLKSCVEFAECDRFAECILRF